MAPMGAKPNLIGKSRLLSDILVPISNYSCALQQTSLPKKKQCNCSNLKDHVFTSKEVGSLRGPQLSEDGKIRHHFLSFVPWNDPKSVITSESLDCFCLRNI